MEGFVDNDFEVDTVGDGEPVEVMKDRSDMVTDVGVCEKTSNRIQECFG